MEGKLHDDQASALLLSAVCTISAVPIGNPNLDPDGALDVATD